MPSSISSLNAAQISQVARAESKDQATKMNLLNRIIDWFKDGVQYKALEQLFDKITDVKERTGQSQQKDFHTEKDRMEAFAELRQLVLPEHRDKFKFGVMYSEEGKLECKIQIADVLIYENKDIGGVQNSRAKFELMLGMYGMRLEDACRNEDDQQLFALLAKMDDEIQGMASLADARQARGSTLVAINEQLRDTLSVEVDELARDLMTNQVAVQTWAQIQDLVKAQTEDMTREVKQAQAKALDTAMLSDDEDDIDSNIQDDIDSEDAAEPAQNTSEKTAVTIQTVPRLEFALPEKAELATETMKMVIRPLLRDDQGMLLTKLKERHDSPVTGEMPDFVMSMLGTLATSLEHHLVDVGAEEQIEARLMLGDGYLKG